ncbi:MAG: twin-arginine translocase TatA/TatE family subunit [Planctomycetota bacterium]
MAAISSSMLLFGWTPGWQELLICAVIFLLLFGSAKLPSLMRNMGRSVNEFKAGMKDKPSTNPPALEEEETPTA